MLTYHKGNVTPLTANFKRNEFDCKCSRCSTTVHCEELSNKLQMMRTYFKKPIIVTSGYRCAAHNAEVGGASQSYHMQGMAADFIIPGVNVSEICCIAEAVGFTGIGMYSDGYVHVDVRPESAKWFWCDTDSNRVETFGGADMDISGVIEVPPNPLNMATEILNVLKKYGFY